jgi:hypothetical protein
MVTGPVNLALGLTLTAGATTAMRMLTVIVLVSTRFAVLYDC